MSLVHHIHSYIHIYGYFAVLAFVCLESAGVPMPGETALVTAAIFASRGDLSIVGVIACAALAAILGDNIGYWVGREFGFPLVLKYGRYVNLDAPRLKLGQYLFQRHGGKIVFFGRFVAFLRAFAALLAGINRLAWPRFFFFNASGGIAWAIIFGLGGYFLGHAFERYARSVGIAALILAIIGAVAASRFIAHHERRLIAEAEAALPGPLVAPTDSEKRG
ncbi:MAG TPA: DedA family protein [Roseiarcus sp.]|nr:DedA family protein [Roseiarcus sp.]